MNCAPGIQVQLHFRNKAAQRPASSPKSENLATEIHKSCHSIALQPRHQLFRMSSTGGNSDDHRNVAGNGLILPISETEEINDIELRCTEHLS